MRSHPSIQPLIGQRRHLAAAATPMLFASATPAAAATDQAAAQVASSGGWYALAIILAAVLAAWALNHRAPKVRAFGTLLAAGGCFAVVAWFSQILGTGLLEHPKPNQTPLDSAKPTILWLQASAALIGGLLLLVAAYRQSRNTETLELEARNEHGRYGRVSRIVHWTTAFLFLALIPIGIFASMIPLDSAFIRPYFVVHKTLGLAVFALLLFRLFWNRQSQRPALDASLKPAERKWAHRVHVILYGMMIAIPVTGYMMTTLHGFGTYIFEWEIPALFTKSKTYVIWGGFHKYLLHYLLYVVLGAHILGALKHHFVDKQADALKRMVG